MAASDSLPSITAVIPTFRRPKLLRRAIESVLAQTYPHFQVCVYDNASGDETAEVVEEFRRRDSRLEYTCRPDNIGAFANFMDGASRVKTPFFAFLSDDDIMLPHFFEGALGGFQRHPEAATSALASIRMYPNGSIYSVPILQWPEGLLLPPSGMLSLLRIGGGGMMPALLVRKEVWEALGGFDQATYPCSDLDFELRVTARLPVVVSREPGVIQVMYSSSLTSEGGLEFAWPSMPRMIEKLTQDMTLTSAARQEAAAILTGWMKRGLVMRGVIRSISRGRWEEAERAAHLLLQECRQERGAKITTVAITICRRLPATRLLFRALVAIRTYAKAIRNLGLQWRFRSYSKLVRVPAVR